MTRHKNRRQHSNLPYSRIYGQTDPQIRGTQLRQTVRLGSTNNLVNMRQSRQRRHQVVLYIAQVEQETPILEDWVFIRHLAAFHEAFEHVDFAVQAANDVGDLFAKNVNLEDELFDVVDAGDEDLILDGLGFGFSGAGEGFEPVDDVVTERMLVNKCNLVELASDFAQGLG